MIQPLAPWALIYAAGLMMGHWLEAPILGAFLGCYLLLLAAWRIERARGLFLLPAVFLFGWLNISTRTAHISPFDIRDLIGEQPRVATVRGRLVETPVERVYVHDEQESWRTLAELEVAQIKLRGGEWHRADGHVLTMTPGTIDRRYVEGQPVEISGLVTRPAIPVADGLFDYRRYLASKGVSFVLKAGSDAEWNAVAPLIKAPITLRFREWAQAMLGRGLPGEDEALRLQWAMLLGWQTALTNEVAEPFMRSGTMHIFAISGLHIALICGIALALLRALSVPRLVCGLLVVPAIWFYTGATGWQASAIRSTVMMTVIIAGWMLRRPSSLLNSLAAAALIILVWDPLELFQASFQLSFFVVLSLAVLGPLLESLKQRVCKLDPLKVYELRPRWERIGIRLGNALWAAFATSLAAFLGSLPLTAYYFHLFTPGSLLANLLVVPTSSAALTSGLGALAAGAISPAAAALFNHSGWFFMRAMEWLSQAVTQIPGSWIHVPSPGIVEFLAYYALLFGVLGGRSMTRRWRWIITGTAACAGTIAAGQWLASRTGVEISIVPLTGSHVVLAREPRRSGDWLINCGNHGSFGLVLKPYLEGKGINAIDHLIIARTDVAHGGAFLDLHDNFPVKAAFLSPQKPLSTPFRNLLQRMDDSVAVHPHATNATTLGPWHILHPDPGDKFRRGQDYAVSMLGTFEGVNVLLLPDLGLAGQNALFNRPTRLDAQIVIAGLPDDGEPLAAGLIARIHPQLIVIADCEYPASRRARPELRARLRSLGIPVLYTRESGALTFRIRGGKWRTYSTLEPSIAGVFDSR